MADYPLRISATSLPDHLRKGLHPIYHLFGAETLLVEECLDQCRQYLIEQGYTERIRFTVEPGFNWDKLNEQSQSMSLFAQKKLIELRIPNGKPGDAGSKALIAYAQMASDTDTILIVVSGEIEKRAQNTKWFKALDSSAVVVELPTISANQLGQWIEHRMRYMGLQFDGEVVNRLAFFVEGNLLAAAQEINLLSLLYGDEVITVSQLESIIADHARFNVYSFTDACLAGSVQRSVRILESLKREQVEPIIILWALTRDTRNLCHLMLAARKGNPQSLFQRYGFWGNRGALASAAIKRLSLGQCVRLLKYLGRADLMAKGRCDLQRKDIWGEIEHIALGLCGAS